MTTVACRGDGGTPGAVQAASFNLPVGVPLGQYRYVRITDLSGGAAGPWWGADIDSVEILP